MIIKTIIQALEKEKGFTSKIKSLIQFLRYYNNLQKGIRTKQIYHSAHSQNPDCELLFNKIQSNDKKLLKTLFNDEVESFLLENKLESKLDFSKRSGMIQIGFNSIFIEKLSPGIWTTGKAVLFIPTKIGVSNKVVVELFSIPPLTVSIGINENKIKQVFMPKLTTKKVEIAIPLSDARKKISEINITTDKLWKPNVVLEKNISIVVGVCIKSIQVIS